MNFQPFIEKLEKKKTVNTSSRVSSKYHRANLPSQFPAVHLQERQSIVSPVNECDWWLKIWPANQIHWYLFVQPQIFVFFPFYLSQNAKRNCKFQCYKQKLACEMRMSNARVKFNISMKLAFRFVTTN